jgi:nucleoside-diphosphate-sugar epimerase
MIRWIRQRLGTGPHEALGEGTWLLLDARHLVDKGGNPAQPIRKLIDEGAQAYRQGNSVVVACDFGISRSNAIAAGILSLVENKCYDLAVQEVMDATAEREIKLDLVEAVRLALGEVRPQADKRAVLVTGATGFIGRHLVARLQETHRVVGPPRKLLDLQNGAVNLANYCARECVGQIIHLAYPREYTNVAAAASSVMMLRTVLDTCRLLKIRLVFISGWVVFSGYSTVALVADEETPLRPKGIYAETKYIEEMLVDLHYRRGDVERSVCRLSPVYGPGGQRPRFIQTFHQAISRKDLVTTHRFRNGRPALDLLYVTDAAEALATVAAWPKSDVFHFGTGVLHSTTELATMIGRISGHAVRHQEIEMDEFTSNIAFPSDNARTQLNWSAKVQVEDGLANILVDPRRRES